MADFNRFSCRVSVQQSALRTVPSDEWEETLADHVRTLVVNLLQMKEVDVVAEEDIGTTTAVQFRITINGISIGDHGTVRAALTTETMEVMEDDGDLEDEDCDAEEPWRESLMDEDHAGEVPDQ